MKIEVVTTPFVCNDCKRIFDKGIKLEATKRSASIKLCHKCHQNTYKLMGELLIPKSPENMLKKS